MIAHEDSKWALSASTYGAISSFVREKQERCLTKPPRIWSDPPLSLPHIDDLSSKNNVNACQKGVGNYCALRALLNNAAKPCGTQMTLIETADRRKIMRAFSRAAAILIQTAISSVMQNSVRLALC